MYEHFVRISNVLHLSFGEPFDSLSLMNQLIFNNRVLVIKS